MWNRALLVVILSASPAAAQIPVARFQISARIMKAGSLSLGPSDTGIAPLQASMAGSSTQIHVRVRPALAGRTVTVPLIARSNSPYRLLVKSVTPQDSANPLQVILRSVDPNAGTRHLMPDATSVRAGGQLAVANGETTIAEGPRISNGGNDATIDNAIRLSLEIVFPQHVSEADLIFMMEFPAN